MLRRFQLLLAFLLVIFNAGSAVAVGIEPIEFTSLGVATGLSNAGPAIVVFAIASALLLTLVFRTSTGHVVRTITCRIGRRRIRQKLSQRSEHVLNDFLLPGAYGGLTRIDHAIVTSGGVLCIQSKHYNGIVFGDADEPQWTNVDGIYRCKFLNPMIQNEGRARALRNVIPDIPVASVIVFTGNPHFASSPGRSVIQVEDLDSYITEFTSGDSDIRDWNEIWLTVRSAALTDEGSRKDFNAQLSFS